MPFVEVPPEVREAMTSLEVATDASRSDCRCQVCTRRHNNVVARIQSQLQLATNPPEPVTTGYADPTTDEEPEEDWEHCEWCVEDRPGVETFGYRELCAPCREEARCCDWCSVAESAGSIYRMDLGDRTQTLWLCEGCRDDLRWCDHCERYFTADAYFPDCDICESCSEASSSRMRAWNYRPDPIFFGSDDTFHFGVEVEMESVSQSTVPGTIGSWGTDALFCKSDGSLYSGVEVVTHPGTLKAWQDGLVIPWSQWEDAVLDGTFGNQEHENTAGIHVHVSRTAFERKGRWSASHMWKFMQLHYRNEVAFKKLSGRDGSTYANWKQIEDRKEVTPKAKAGLGYSHDRYAVINVNNEATVECRYFQSDQRQEIILKNVELVHAAVEYTRHLPAKAVKDGLLDYRYFQAWFKRRKERYPNLVKYAEGHPGLAKANRDNQRKLEKRIRMEVIRERRRQQQAMRLYAEFDVPVPPDPGNLYWDRMWPSSSRRMRDWWASPHGVIYRQFAVSANAPDRLRTLMYMVRENYRRYLQSNQVRIDDHYDQPDYDNDQLRTMRAWHAWGVLEAILEVCQMELTPTETALVQGEINSLANWN